METGVRSNLERLSRSNLGRFVAVARHDGIRAAVRRAAARTLPAIQQDHFLVLRLPLQDTVRAPAIRATDDLRDQAETPLERTTAYLQFDELTGGDDPDLDALVTVDGWTTMRAARVRWLQDGARCFLAKRDGQVIGSSWYTTRHTYYEPYLKRELELSPDESYVWGNYCMPEWRGRGIIPQLMDYAMNQLAAENCKRELLGIVRSSNRSSLRALAKSGWERVGRIGFIEAFGFRLHYILGRKAFRNTRKPLFLQRAR